MPATPETTPDSFMVQNLNYEGTFVSPVRNTHRKERYAFTEDGNTKRVVKYLDRHSASAEVIGSGVFRAIGLKAPETYMGEVSGHTVVIMEDLSNDFVADLTYGNGGILTDKDLKKQFKKAILPAIVIGDYDRVPWNSMISRDFSRVSFVDFGACCGSRAQGGYNGFNPWIDVEEVRQVIADPYDLDVISNTAFKETVDIRKGKIVITDPDLLNNQAQELKTRLTDDVIDKIVARCNWPDNSKEKGHQQNLEYVNGIINRLEEEMAYYRDPNSRDYIKTSRALITYKRIRDEFGADIGGYMSHTLKRRRDAVLDLFLKK